MRKIHLSSNYYIWENKISHVVKRPYNDTTCLIISMKSGKSFTVMAGSKYYNEIEREWFLAPKVKKYSSRWFKKVNHLFSNQLSKSVPRKKHIDQYLEYTEGITRRIVLRDGSIHTDNTAIIRHAINVGDFQAGILYIPMSQKDFWQSCTGDR